MARARCNQLWYCYEGGEQSAWYWRTDELQDLCDAGDDNAVTSLDFGVQLMGCCYALL